MSQRRDRREHKAPETQTHVRPSEPGIVSARTIVVLDRDPRVRAVVVNALIGEGYRATGTADPAVAVGFARTGTADLVLADLAMAVLEVVPRWQRRASDGNPGRMPSPCDDGYAVLRALQTDPAPFRHLAVMLREDAAADRDPRLRFGVVDYVPKPVQPRLLKERMEEIFEVVDAPRAPNVLELISTPVKPKRRPRAPALESLWPEPPAEPDGGMRAMFESLSPGLRTALVADGDAGSRAFVRSLLAPHGFTVHEAADGQEALSVALAKRPWLIISDVNMPRMDGFEFCRRVRDHALLRRTPLILYSAWDDYTERYLGLKLGADEYLSKLTPVRELLIRLQLILRRYSDLGTRTRKGAGMEGTLELVGTPGMLQMCHLGRLSGTCTVHSGPRTAVVTMRDGEIISAQCGAFRGAEAIYELLAWTQGEFEFAPGEIGGGSTLKESFDYLLLEGCRRQDEAQKPAEND
jgi:DNA-binding response OmpR family regulator